MIGMDDPRHSHPRERRRKQMRLKITMLGVPNVGKTSLVSLAINGKFPEIYRPTIHKNFQVQINIVQSDGGEIPYMVEITDTEGLVEETVRDGIVNQQDGFILVYSIENEPSFNTIESVVDNLLEKIEIDKIPVMLVGNKIDLEGHRQVSKDMANNLKDVQGLSHCKEMSAKNCNGIPDIFKTLVKEIIERKQDSWKYQRNDYYEKQKSRRNVVNQAGLSANASETIQVPNVTNFGSHQNTTQNTQQGLTQTQIITMSTTHRQQQPLPAQDPTRHQQQPPVKSTVKASSNRELPHNLAGPTEQARDPSQNHNQNQETETFTHNPGNSGAERQPGHQTSSQVSGTTTNHQQNTTQNQGRRRQFSSPHGVPHYEDDPRPDPNDPNRECAIM